MKIAIPTNAPGGLEAERSGHFGHCDIFTVIDLSSGNEVTDVTTIINEGHEAGGCMAPVTLLQKAGVEAIVVAGLGKRPMQGFNEVGITVYHADQGQLPDVKSVIENLQQNRLVVMHPAQTCQGSGNCQH
ncbi:NifB/NifX family molybdenum-iron cluster-binding protein [Desulfopila inferna]|uniref:NifB/NifX family molybdenum-iron cluster-binding protein n=1 Tax=Desulfopila inferna TaxID=468528 RepID=UPI001964ACC3|nr:NifB/NifX family molybdenum-iron cluster-binding protein [Desulfopila inferna]MBM9604329.1 NifB/NifX family molybdenum-iron cluster-binding protein [Desulfopila inferna]